MSILITAFDPFGGEETNASMELLRALPETAGGVKLEKRLLPTVFGRSAELAIAAAEELRPDAVVALGQAAGREAVTVERLAVNLMDASSPDNEGKAPVDAPVVPGAPAAYFATLPVKAMRDAMLAAGTPAALSCSAGTFVCNNLMYALLHYAARRRPGLPCGFIHLPRLAEQTGRASGPTRPKETGLRGLTTALEALAQAL